MSQKINDYTSQNFDLFSSSALEGPRVLGFFAREKPPIFTPEEIDEFNTKLQALEETPVQILRPILFFHSEQKGITLGKLKEFFSDKAIKLFEKDGYIKIRYKQ